MTNNFDLYKEYIRHMCPDFPQSNKGSIEDKFYVIELIRRGKDNPDLPAANVHFKNYYIYCWDDFDKYIPEIIELCNIMRMRAYVSVNWKSTKQIALNTIAAMATRVAQGDYKKIYSEWSSQTGLFSQRNENVWVLDLDNIEPMSNEVTELMKVINECRSQFETNCIITIPTRSGCHLLTRPFDVQEFSNKVVYNEIAMNAFKEFKLNINSRLPVTTQVMNWVNESLIHKNHITLLYENL